MAQVKEAIVGNQNDMATEARAETVPASSVLPATPSFGWKLLLAAGIGGLLAACFPPIGMSACLPVCIGAFLWLLRGVTRRQAFYIGFTFGLVSFCAGLFWFSRLFGMAVVSLCALLAVFPTIFAVVYVWLRERLPHFPAWLLAPLLWTGIEYYRSELFVLNFGWMGLGYGVINVPVLAACASWFGCYGLTFGIVLLGALLAREVTANKAGGRTRFERPAILVGLWLLLFCFSAPAPVPERPLHVRLVQANSEDEDSFYRLSRYDTMQSAAKPDVIVWPEYSFVRDPTLEPKVWKQLQQVAQEQSAYLLFGAKDQFDRDDQNHYRNTAFLLDPNGKEVGRHVKNHPVHFIRDGVKGTDASAIPTSFGRLGVGICFDMDYPDVARRLAADGAEVFLVPNDDPPEWGPVQQVQHRLMFQMRAAECGKWLARADVAGGTSAAAPNGQEMARVTTTNAARLDVTIGRNQGRTLFVRGGWRFGAILPARVYRFMRVGMAANALTREQEPAELTIRSADKLKSVFLALMLGLLTGGLAVPQMRQSDRVVTRYEASEEDFPNPERGFHKNTDLLTARDLHWVREQGYSLVRAYVQLDACRDRPLSEDFLQKLNTGFGIVRAAGIKVLPIFAYNFPSDEDIKAGHLKDIPDAPLDIVRQHLRQLKPVLHTNQDVIAAVELGFVGAWGEWHSSKNGLDTPENKRIIHNAILDALPPSRMMQLRYPADLITLYPAPLTAKQAHSGNHQARTGWANMCFLSNEHDSGTYFPLERKAEMQAYLEKTTPYVVVGGETCQITPGQTRGDCATAQDEMARFHFSYLNRDFYAPALERWKQDGCLSAISRRLGYRFRLTTSDIPRIAHPGETVTMRFSIVNEGYATPYNPRLVFVILRSKANGKLYRFAVSADPRQWQPGKAEYAINARISLPADFAAGEYALLLHFPDPIPSLANRPEYAIRLANRDIWEPETGLNRLPVRVCVTR